MAIRDSMKKGTAELVVLHLLRTGRKYGYQIAQEIAARSNGLFTLQEGSLYPTLYRLGRRTDMSLPKQNFLQTSREFGSIIRSQKRGRRIFWRSGRNIDRFLKESRKFCRMTSRTPDECTDPHRQHDCRSVLSYVDFAWTFQKNML